MIDVQNTLEMRQHFLSCYPNEGCGFVINGMFVGAENIHEEPGNNFRVAPQQVMQAYQTGKLQAVVHSHTKPSIEVDELGRFYDARTPSEDDMKYQDAMRLPWGIVSCDGEEVSRVLWFGLNKPAELIGRPFIHNVYDCYTLIRDAYIMNHGITMGVYPRPMMWSKYDDTRYLYEENFAKEGFAKLPNGTDPQSGDLVFFHIASDYVNHAGYCIGNGEFLHHTYNKLSKKDSLNKWHKQVAYFVRHASMQ